MYRGRMFKLIAPNKLAVCLLWVAVILAALCADVVIFRVGIGMERITHHMPF